MRQYAYLVVRPQLSSANPNFSKPRTRTANLDFWSRLAHQLLERLKSTIPKLQFYLTKKASTEKLGLGIDNPCRIVFLSLRMNKCLERVNDRHFWNPGVFSYAIIPRCRPNSRVFFLHCQIYSLCTYHDNSHAKSRKSAEVNCYDNERSKGRKTRLLVFISYSVFGASRS